MALGHGGASARQQRRMLLAMMADGGNDSDEEEEEEEEEVDEEGEKYVEEDDAASGSEDNTVIAGVACEGLDEVELVWMKRMAKWIACFWQASIKWAFVDDGSASGIKKRGLVITSPLMGWDGITRVQRKLSRQQHNGCHVRAPPEVCRSEIVMARQWAFRSAIHDTNIRATF